MPTVSRDARSNWSGWSPRTDTVRNRLRGRDDEAKLARHLETLAEQEASLDAIAIEDFTVVNDRPATSLWRGKSSPARVGSARLGAKLSGAPTGTSLHPRPCGDHWSATLAAGRSRM